MWKNNPYIYLFQRMWQYAPSKKKLFLMLSFSGISKLIWLIEPWILGQIVNLLQIQGVEARSEIKYLLMAFTLITFFGRAFHGRSRIWEETIKFAVAE